MDNFHFLVANYSDLFAPVGHPKWWFSKGIPPKSPKHSGLGIIAIYPDFLVAFIDSFNMFQLFQNNLLYGVGFSARCQRKNCPPYICSSLAVVVLCFGKDYTRHTYEQPAHWSCS